MGERVTSRGQVLLVSWKATPYLEHQVRVLERALDDISVSVVYLSQAGASHTYGPDASGHGRWRWLPGTRFRSTRAFLDTVGSWRHAAAATRRLRGNRVLGVIVSGYNRPGFLRVILGCRIRRVPVLLRGDSNVLDERSKPAWLRTVKRAYLWLLSHTVDGALPVGTAGARYFTEYGFRPEGIHIVPYEPEYGALLPAVGDTRSEAADRLGLPMARNFIVFCGRIESIKRVDLLLESFADISDDLDDWDVVIAGTGSLEGTLRSTIPSGLAGRVHWLGWCDRPRMADAYHVSRVFVLPSAQEPWGVVVNEAMACGLVPVLSDAVGAGVDLVEHNRNGFKFPNGDATRLSSALVAAARLSGSVGIGDLQRSVLSEFHASYPSGVGVEAALGLDHIDR